ncbi:MAG: type IV secretion system DNA-binding domain-containing protein [Lachnospiraceae bacterium]|nr:type IV secretion system DNA-binding domain-containing protein [Lachnospiraceae bacterium]
MKFQNSGIIKEVMEGQRLLNNPVTSGNFHVDGKNREGWNFNDDLLSTHMLAIGSIGSGKTNTIYFIVREIIKNISEGDVLVFFDSKGDFLKRFYRPGDFVIGNPDQYSGYKLSYWNVYEELKTTGGDREDSIREIATSLFRKRIETAKDPTFASGARDIFCSILEAQFRDGKTNLDNHTLKNAIRSFDIKGLKEVLNNHTDMNWINMYMHNEGSATTQSYLSPLGSVVNDVFTAHFGGKGDFSIKKAIRNRGGKSIFLEYDIVNSNLIDVVYTVLLDLACKEALANENNNRFVYFVLDEFPLIPKMNYIDNLLNFGRSRGVRVIAGIQNVNQINGAYGDSLGASILSGFSTYLIFHLFDEESRKVVSERHGKNRKLIRLPYTDATQSGNQEYEQGNVIEDWDITELKKGECIVSLPYENPFIFNPDIFPEIKPRISVGKDSPKIQIRGI